jgi:hypothetical protein
MTTGESIRAFCKDCVNSNQSKVIKACGGEMVRATKKPCPLFQYRLKGKGTLRAIRKHCVECMGGSFRAVEDCQTTDCKLYPYRMGKSLSKTRGVGRASNFQNQRSQIEV